ncbi:LLM class flavin-dependent oxidoreductase [Actinokineospora enzanensis]|uniref:LLM class flavin-dependent oxidoreductase n=1 Tax=Actinokineospora enzanensis TaxID=155975 RepID=UPI0003642896|nr:LLM class flavin-dependent oxidoreductase [Actinokineospora enzanensis]
MGGGQIRLGMVANPRDPHQWRAAVRCAEGAGYDVLLTADNLHAPAPSVSLGMAAGMSQRLRLGTLVMAAPLRAPRLAAWEAHSLSVLSGGRFKLGIGTGNPRMRAAAEESGLSDGASALDRVAVTVEELRALDGAGHTPVMIAAAGPRARALAARVADTVMLAAPAMATREEVADLARQVRSIAGDRPVELAMTVFVIEDELESWAQGLLGATTADLINHDSLSLLRGSPKEMADELLRRRDQLGVGYFSVHGRNTDLFVPVPELLNGR